MTTANKYHTKTVKMECSNHELICIIHIQHLKEQRKKYSNANKYIAFDCNGKFHFYIYSVYVINQRYLKDI